MPIPQPMPAGHLGDVRYSCASRAKSRRRPRPVLSQRCRYSSKAGEPGWEAARSGSHNKPLSALSIETADRTEEIECEACPYRKSNPNVLVMQPTDMRLRNNPADALNFARNRGVLVQRQMRTGLVVICHV